MKVKVIDHDEFLKDTVSGAVVNVDDHALAKAKRKKLEAQQKQNEIESLKSDVADIKAMLNQLLDRVNNGGN